MNQRLTMQVMAQVSRTETRSRRPQMSAPNAPSLPLDSPVDAADKVSAIDFINRVNWLFDAWDIDAMVEAFLPDSVTHHTHGVVRGRIETRRFFQEQIPYTVHGGWRIFERRVGPTSMNDGLTPGGASNSGCMDW